MRIKMWLHYPLLQNLDSYKVRLCFIVLSVTVCTVVYICLFRGDQVFMDFSSFLPMIIYEVLHTWCLRHNICSAWFLDIRISTCCNSDQSLLLFKFNIFVLNTIIFYFFILITFCISIAIRSYAWLQYDRKHRLLSQVYI